MTNKCESGHKSGDMFEGWVICAACGLEHEQSKRIVWSFNWGYKDTRCPRCGHAIEEVPGSSFPVQKTHIYTGSFGD